MRAYLVTTGSLFGLLAAVHVWRAIDQWPGLLTNTGELVEAGIGVLAAALGLWAWRLFRRVTRHGH